MADIVRSESQLGAALRRRRRSLSLTQSFVSSRTGKRQATLSRLEAGEGATLETLFAVLAALDLELDVRQRTRSLPEDIEDLL